MTGNQPLTERLDDKTCAYHILDRWTNPICRDCVYDVNCGDYVPIKEESPIERISRIQQNLYKPSKRTKQ